MTQEEGKPVRSVPAFAATELALSARESRSTSRAAENKSAKIPVKPSSLLLEKADEGRRAKKKIEEPKVETKKSTPTVVPKSKLQAQVSSKAQKPVQPIKATKKKEEKQLDLGFQSSKRGRPAKNSDDTELQ